MQTMQHIMVVDNSTVSRALVRRVLEDSLEAHITTCDCAEQALQLLEQSDYQLVTTALLLPDMDGLDLCRQIRRSKRHASTPVVVISGDANSRLLKEGFAAGVTDYFDKSQGYLAFGQFIKTFSQRNWGLVGRILYVEDSETVAHLTCGLLERHGLRVTHTRTAESALLLLQTDTAHLAEEGGNFDLVITDFHLKQEMTGGDLLHAVRTRYHQSQQELPFLIITSNDDIQIQVELFHAGANDFVTKPLVEEILMARVRSLLMIKHQYDALKQQMQMVERMATTDALTGTRNRRYLVEHGTQQLQRIGESAWIAIVDLDHFKQVNDNHGHAAGDAVLRAVGKVLLETVDKGMAVRYGGEEFALLWAEKDADQAANRMQQLRRRIERLRPAGIRITASLGLVAVADYPETDQEELLRLADEALYAAKEGGRNQIYRYSKEHHLQLLAET